MKIAFILGNGFDINIGIDTRYTDFYSYYLAQDVAKRPISVDEGMAPSNHPELVKMMKSSHSQYWSDLELLFGSWIRHFPSVDTIRGEKSHLEQEINNYLRRQQSRVSITESHNLKAQLDASIREFMDLCDYVDENNFYEIEFITFNYTDVIDRIIEAVNRNGHNNIVYHKPYHIHGSIDQTVILGVDNEDQYTYPPSRHAVDELRTIMLKPALNSIVRHQEVSKIRNVIHNMDAVIIYGASIGDTDATWWKIISEWLFMESGHKVSIIGYVDDSNPASATAQAQIDSYGNRFRRLMLSQYKSKEGKEMIETYKCEEWMFRFMSAVVSVKPRGTFDNLIVEV